MPDTGDVLLDVIDYRGRLIQHGAILVGIALLVAARFAVDLSGVYAALALIAAGLGLLAIAGSVWQRWSIDYQGYRIVVENNPLRGERLLVGGVVAAKGAFGIRSHMTTTIATPSGPEEVIVRTDAGLISFRCVVRVVRGGGPASASDAELLAEVRRRGLA